MSNALKLRKLCPEDLPLYRCMRARQAEGRQAALRRLAPPRGYAAAHATYGGRDYAGWVDLAGLLRLRYPELDGVAWHAIDERYALDLFDEAELLGAIPGPAGGWESVRLTSRAETSQPERVLLCLDEPERATALFETFPDASRPGDSIYANQAGALPLVMRLSIGSTRMPRAQCLSIEAGDIVVVQFPRNVAYVEGEPIGGFDYKGMDIMLNERMEEEQVWDDEADPGLELNTDAGDGRNTSGAEDTFGEGAVSDAVFDVGSLPVKLEFVLQEERTTVAQLTHYFAGTVVPMRPDALGRIAIRANGRLLGSGELIQVGEHLAVEIKTLQLPRRSD